MKKTCTILFSILVFAATCFLVSATVGWQPLLHAFSTLSVIDMQILIALMCVASLARSARVAVSLQLSHAPVTLFHVCNTHNLLNNLLPMRTGELTFPVLMRHHFGLPHTESGMHLIMYRLLDLLALLSVGLVVFLSQFNLWLVLISIVLTAGLLALSNPIRRALIQLAANWQQPPSFILKVSQALQRMPTSGKRYWLGIFLTYLQWSAKLAAFLYLVAQMSDIGIPDAILAIVGADLSSVLPIHGVAGSGTFEAGFVLAGSLGDGHSEILLSAAVQLHLFLLASAIAMATFSFILMSAIKLLTSPAASAN